MSQMVEYVSRSVNLREDQAERLEDEPLNFSQWVRDELDDYFQDN